MHGRVIQRIQFAVAFPKGRKGISLFFAGNTFISKSIGWSGCFVEALS